MSARRPLKPYLNGTQQLALLKSRGLCVPDDAAGIQGLARFGYYRLSGYYYPLRKTNPIGVPGRRDEFVENSSLELVIQIAEFDKGLRLLALDALAAMFAPIDGPTLVNWLRCFNFIRNVAAHHSRLWNRTLPDVLALPEPEECLDLEPVHTGPNAKSKVFGAFTCLRLLLRKIHPDSTWPVRFKEHIATFPNTELVSITSGGFQQGWTDAPIWAD